MDGIGGGGSWGGTTAAVDVIHWRGDQVDTGTHQEGARVTEWWKRIRFRHAVMFTITASAGVFGLVDLALNLLGVSSVLTWFADLLVLLGALLLTPEIILLLLYPAGEQYVMKEILKLLGDFVDAFKDPVGIGTALKKWSVQPMRQAALYNIQAEVILAAFTVVVVIVAKGQPEYVVPSLYGFLALALLSFLFVAADNYWGPRP